MSLEQINYSTDSGTQAIEKLDMNQRAINNQVSNNAEKINDLNGKFLETTLTPMNGWSNNTYTVSKLTRIGNMVYLQANLVGGVCEAFTQIFAIPEGYRPKNMLFLNCTQFSGGIKTEKGLRVQENGLFDLDLALTTGCRLDINTSWRAS